MKNKINDTRPIDLAAKEKVIFNTRDFHEIYERLANVGPTALRQWGKMDVVQMLNHLKIATGSSLDVYQLKDESVFLLSRTIKFLVLRILKQLPKNSNTPDGFKIEMNNVLDFETEKDGALTMLEKAYASKKKIFIHPFFGAMSRAEWGKLIYLHFDHHLRQFGS